MISERDAIAIAEIVFYVPALVIAITLAVRHGFRRSSGWRFLLTFALARLIQSGLQLGTIADPKNTSLYIGVFILLTVAILPLELCTLGLLSRLITNINRVQTTLVTPRHIQLIELVTTVGFILGIVGGYNAGTDYGDTGHYVVSSETKGAIALFIVAFAAILAITVSLIPAVSAAEAGERRILLAVGISLPFLLVRILYSAIETFANPPKFSLLGGSDTVLLCMALLEEAIVVALYEAFGLTLKRIPKRAEGQLAEPGGEPQSTKGEP